MFEFGWEAYLLLGAGLLVVILEVFFPSGGLLGIASAVCLGLGAYFAWRTGGLAGVFSYGVSLVLLVPLTAVAGLKVLPKTPMGRRIILAEATLPEREATEQGLEGLVQHTGRAVTALRPAGIADIDDRRVDVVTRGGHLESGEEIRVVKVEGNRVIVERATD